MPFLDKNGVSRLWMHIIAKLNTKVDRSELDDLKQEISGSIGAPDITTDDEVIDMMFETDILPVVADSDDSVLTDENGDILLW